MSSPPPDRPTVRQLEGVLAVARHLSFRRAAEATFLTQPALSDQIQKVEALLGVRLFERDRRRVLVTPAGEEVVARAERVLAEVDSLMDTARSHAAPFTGTLRLGVIPTIAPYALPAALPAIRESYPELRLVLREERTAELVRQTRAGELDLLLLALEAELEDLATRTLYPDPFVLAIDAHHDLAGKSSVPESALDGLTMLLLDDGHCLRDQTLAICRAAGSEEADDLRATSLNTLCRMAAQGLGATLLPRMATLEVDERDGLALVPLTGRGSARTIGLAWRPTTGRLQEIDALARLFTEHAPA